MYSVSILPARATPVATAISKSFRCPRWQWSDANYRELVATYMNFVDHKESTTGTSPVNPHLNPTLIGQVFSKFSHIAPRNCILHALKDCHNLEEEPYELAMNPLADTYLKRPQINIRHRNQWDILKIERMIDQIAFYKHQLTLTLLTLPNNNKQTIAALTNKIQERQRCIQLHPTRYYRPGP